MCFCCLTDKIIVFDQRKDTKSAHTINANFYRHIHIFWDVLCNIYLHKNVKIPVVWFCLVWRARCFNHKWFYFASGTTDTCWLIPIQVSYLALFILKIAFPNNIYITASKLLLLNAALIWRHRIASCEVNIMYQKLAKILIWFYEG